MATAKPDDRTAYRIFQPVTTRWMDNDVYGHINNVTYYSFFDTAVNSYLIEIGGLDIRDGAIVGYVVNSSANYFSALAFPDRIEAGLRVDRLGNSSVQYGVGIFRVGEELAAASGHFVHVFVDRSTQRPVPIPGTIRTALERIAAN